MEQFKLTERQELACSLAEQGQSIFLTGEGGVGKSVTVRSIMNKLKGKCLLAAPTGIAAINVGGSTLHSLFGLPLGVVVQSDYMKPPTKKLKDLVSSTQCLIIDEISMVRSDNLDLIDHRLKQVKNNGKPFGGIQVIFVGDFFQLSPVVSYREKTIFYDKYASEFCFTSKAWAALNPAVVELTEVMRQEDLTQVTLLRSLRKQDENFRTALKEINNLTAKEPIPNALSLCTLLKDVELINNFRYNNTKSEEITYPSNVKGAINNGDKPVPDLLKLKVGVDVIIVANNPEGGYYNGERGKVKSMSPLAVEVEKESGEVVIVEAFEWKKFDFQVSGDNKLERVEIGSYTQMPLLLGYAISIHRAQGMTLGSYNLDLGSNGAFAHGQTYVALSRAKDLSKVHLALPLRETDVIVNKAVKEFYGTI